MNSPDDGLNPTIAGDSHDPVDGFRPTVDPTPSPVRTPAPAPANAYVDPNATLDSDASLFIEKKIRDKFESAWKNSLRGEPPVSIENLVKEAPEPMRSTLLRELARLEKDYKVKFARAHSSETVAETIADDGSRGGGGMDAHSGGDSAATIDARQPGYGGTVDSDPDSLDFVIKQQRVKPKESQGLPQPTVRGYEILGELGRGGMGVVYKARQKGLNRVVALKMVLAGAHAGTEQLARFQIEAEAVAHLQHANMVQIFEVGEQDGLPYFSLEYIDGGSLAQRLGGSPMPQREAAALLEQLAHGMAYAHDNGIIHRDLKPANILLTKSGVPKITDFGLAKRLEGDSSQTRSGTLMGTPSYMAPEQAKGDVRATGPLSDQYALGAMLYEMLTGRPPFQGTTLLETLEQVRTQEPVPPSRLQPKIARDIETICIKCLQKDPKQRYSSTTALAEDLQRFVAGEPINARPIGKVEQVWRWCRRKPLEASLYATIAGAAILVVTGLFGLWARTMRERDLVDQTRRNQTERFLTIATTVKGGDARRAKDLLRYSDPNLERNPKLAGLNADFGRLRKQVDAYLEFKKQLDQVRYLHFLKGLPSLKECREECAKLLNLLDNIQNHKDIGRFGMPELIPSKQQILTEEYFDAYFIASQVEWQYAKDLKDAGEKEKSHRLVFDWLEKAEKLMPKTRSLYVRRAGYFDELGKKKESDQDLNRANGLSFDSPLDHFYHGDFERQRARAAMAKKDQQGMAKYYTSAQSEYAAVLRERLESFWSYFEWASCMGELGSLDQAFIGFTACIDIDDRPPWPYNNRGAILHKLNRNDLAEIDLTKAIERDPRYADAYSNLAYVHASLNKPSEARDDLTKAIAIEPKNIDFFFRRAGISFNLKDFEVARDDYSKAIAINPQSLGVYRNRVQAFLALKDTTAALADLEFLRAKAPKDPEHSYLMGSVYMARMEYDNAIKCYEESLAQKADQPLVRLAIAEIEHWRGECEQAIKAINVVVNILDSANAWYLNDRPDVYRTMGKAEDALADCRRSIELDPKKVDAYVTMSLIYRDQQKIDKAREILDQMVKTCESSDAYLRRAEFLRDLEEFDRAQADCRKAKALDKTSILPDLAAAAVLAANGEAEAATKEADRLLTRIVHSEGHALLAEAQVWGLAAKSWKRSGKPGAAELSRKAIERSAKFIVDAVTLGFYELSYQELNRLIDDPALELVRQQPEVAKLPWFRLARHR